MPCVRITGHRERAEVWANDVGSLVLYCAMEGEFLCRLERLCDRTGFEGIEVHFECSNLYLCSI